MSLLSNIRSQKFPFLNRIETVAYPFLASIFFFLFLLIFQPFGVNNYDPSESFNPDFVYGLTIFTLSALIALLVNENGFRYLFLKLSRSINLYLWFLWSSLWLCINLYFTYNILGGWHDFGFLSFLDFFKNLSILYFIPFAGLWIYARIRDLNRDLSTYFDYQQKSEDKDKMVVINSENQKETISIRLDSLVYISSEDNYISVFFLEGDKLKRSLIRRSLKSVSEENLHPSIIRCHRSYVINLYHLKQLRGNKNKMELVLDNVDFAIPVSRQYMDELRTIVS